MRPLPLFASLAILASGLLACGGDPSVNVTLVVTVDNGSSGARQSADAAAPSTGLGEGKGDAASTLPDGGAGQGKGDAQSPDGSVTSCPTGTPCDTGSVVIEAGINHCPEIQTTTTSRTNTTTSEVLVSSADRDADPLTYAWTATSGTFSNPSYVGTTYTCGAPGMQTLTVVVSDGRCQASRDIQIMCP